ncbi:uncharacterized protein [Argopecten irradians]|uniref:uncharacterized protein n=1 Tax=Argopecten irradians TaxID=31199 RepID=UPI003711259C
MASTPTTTASTTTTTPFTISCYSGFCSGDGCTANITSKCSSTYRCMIEKENNATDTYFTLSCVSFHCVRTATKYCCPDNDCNRVENEFASSGGHALSSWIGNILVIFATMFVIRQTTTLGY